MTAPELVIRDRILHSLREDALTAAAILKWTPGMIGDEEIGSWLRRIGAGTVRRETVRSWLHRAGVNPLLAGRELSTRQRYMLAGQLLGFAKEQR